MVFNLTTDRHPPITSQVYYPLCNAATNVKPYLLDTRQLSHIQYFHLLCHNQSRLPRTWHHVLHAQVFSVKQVWITYTAY